MSEIQVILPLSVFAGAESLTPEGITAFLADATKAKERAEQAERNETALAQKVVDWGNRLDRILNEDLHEFQKLQYLRELANDTRQFTNFVKGKIQ